MNEFCRITQDIEGSRLECVKGDYHIYLPETTVSSESEEYTSLLSQTIDGFVAHILEYHREYID